MRLKVAMRLTLQGLNIQAGTIGLILTSSEAPILQGVVDRTAMKFSRPFQGGVTEIYKTMMVQDRGARRVGAWSDGTALYKMCPESPHVTAVGVLNIARKDGTIIPSPSWRDKDNGLMAEPLLLRWSGMRWGSKSSMNNRLMKTLEAETEFTR